jgi:hypothetical protein
VHAAFSRNTKNTNGYPSKRPEDQQLLGKRAKWVEKEEIELTLDAVMVDAFDAAGLAVV